MPVVNKFCCCCQLKTGVVILGWLGLVSAVLHIASSGALYADRGAYAEFENGQTIVLILSNYLPVYIAYGVISLVTYILMIWGASSGNRFLLLPWMIMQMISLVIIGLVILIGGIVCLASDWEGRYIVAAMIYGIGIPCFAVGLYLWLCVLSCFQEIRDSGTVEQNVLLELPKTVQNIVADYRPPEYEKLDSYPTME